QKPPRQGNVAGNARAFFADRFLRDLHQNFLAFFQKIGDLRKILCLRPPEAPPTSSASATKSSTPGAVSIIPGPRRPLGVGGSCSRRSHFSAGVDGTIAAAFCVEQRLCFSLSFFELGFICSGFVHIFGLNS